MDKPTEEKEPDKTGELDLPKYIQPFTHLFNKKKFKVLPQKREWDHEINLVEQAPRELNTKAYTVGMWKTKDFTVTLTYVKITSSGINCALKNLRGGKSRSGKGY